MFSMRASAQVLSLLVLAGVLGGLAKEQFHRHKIYRVVPRDQNQVAFLDNLLKNDPNLDFWTYPVGPGDNVDIRVGPTEAEEFESMMNANNIQFTVVNFDLEFMIEEERVPARAGGFDGSYHRVGEIHQEIKSLARIHSDIASIINLGKSHENRDMFAIKINKGSSKKKLFFFNCGIHAREWISPATCMYMIRQMLETRNSDTDVQFMLANYEWVILPVLNVDGYEYTHTNNRMWRKTRTPNQGSSCRGSDPNRNWNYKFAGVGTSSSKCSDIYTGSQAFSEPVTYNVGKYLYRRRRELKGYIDFHAYSQLWMSPWGYKNAYPNAKDYAKQERAMKAAVRALTAVHGTKYKYGPAAITIYPTTGDTTDWTYGVLGVVHSYCVELRPQGRPGFILPPDKIVPVGQETFAGLKALTRNM